jgi:hypothetical protein
VEHRTGSGVAAAGVAPDADPIEVDPRVPAGEILDAGDLVGQRVVLDVFEVGVVERLGVPMPSIATTMKPSSASDWWSPREGMKLRLPTEPVCGPG